MTVYAEMDGVTVRNTFVCDDPEWAAETYPTSIDISALSVGIGWTFDADEWRPPKPFPSWLWFDTVWQPPTPQTDPDTHWDEETVSWKLPPPPPTDPVDDVLIATLSA